jgi:hypothetical protein
VTVHNLLVKEGVLSAPKKQIRVKQKAKEAAAAPAA